MAPRSGTESAAILASADLGGFRHALIAWADESLRDLPWRRTRDPWAVLVSELMLQQTNVERVEPKWRAFLDRFPTPNDCAAASVADVIVQWTGLGYNRRAVRLHAAACLISTDHQGCVPMQLDELTALPGIGAYTARAVRTFAFELDEAVLDTNAARVIARALAGRPMKPIEAQDLADALLPRGRAWLWNQAMLDLGARVCTLRRPRCGDCPAATCCRWHVIGNRPPDPAVDSAYVSTGQSRFEGSDRQGRGRLVEALRGGSIARSELAAVMGWPGDDARASRVIAGLIADGLVEWHPSGVVLRLTQSRKR